MIIEINDTKTIGSITKLFTEYYPFLKIELYSKPHHWQEGSSSIYLLPHDKTIGEVRIKHNAGIFTIKSQQKTGKVEQEFSKKFGLNVQIFRCHGDRWIQTAGTDELTLKEQNEIGKIATQDLLHGTDRKFEWEKPL